MPLITRVIFLISISTIALPIYSQSRAERTPFFPLDYIIINNTSTGLVIRANPGGCNDIAQRDYHVGPHSRLQVALCGASNFLYKADNAKGGAFITDLDTRTNQITITSNPNKGNIRGHQYGTAGNIPPQRSATNPNPVSPSKPSLSSCAGSQCDSNTIRSGVISATCQVTNNPMVTAGGIQIWVSNSDNKSWNCSFSCSYISTSNQDRIYNSSPSVPPHFTGRAAWNDSLGAIVSKVTGLTGNCKRKD